MMVQAETSRIDCAMPYDNVRHKMLIFKLQRCSVVDHCWRWIRAIFCAWCYHVRNEDNCVIGIQLLVISHKSVLGPISFPLHVFPLRLCIVAGSISKFIAHRRSLLTATTFRWCIRRVFKAVAVKCSPEKNAILFVSISYLSVVLNLWCEIVCTTKKYSSISRVIATFRCCRRATANRK